MMTPSHSPHFDVGIQGEACAVCYLKRIGYQILQTDVKVGPHDQIDILAWDPEDRVLVFAEVKARSQDHADYRPELNMDARKRKALKRGVRRWIAQRNYQGGYRIDLVCVVRERVVRHIKEISWER